MANPALKPAPNGLPAVEIIKRRFKKLPKGIIQVGAHNGREVRKFYRSGVTRGVFIDPLDDTFAMLQKRAELSPEYQAIQALVGDEDGKQVDFHISSNTGESSSFLEPSTHKEIKPNITFADAQTMTLRTLDSLLDENDINSADYDMMMIDTQGAEMHVMRGALSTLKHIKFIWMEVSIGEIYKGDTPLSRIVTFMETLGFEIAFCELKVFGWGDALFIHKSQFIGRDD